MLQYAIEAHLEWVSKLEMSLKDEKQVQEILPYVGDVFACPLGYMLNEDEFQSRVSQQKFMQIFCEHMLFHDVAVQLIRVLQEQGKTPEAVVLHQRLDIVSASLFASLNNAMHRV